MYFELRFWGLRISVNVGNKTKPQELWKNTYFHDLHDPYVVLGHVQARPPDLEGAAVRGDAPQVSDSLKLDHAFTMVNCTQNAMCKTWFCTYIEFQNLQLIV